MAILADVLSLLVACLVGVGPVMLVAVLQNRRDLRARALLQTVANQLPSEALRSDVAVDVRCRLLFSGATVRLDLGRAPAPRVWATAAELRNGLPAWVRLEVDGYVDGPLAVPRPLHVTAERPQPGTLRLAA